MDEKRMTVEEALVILREELFGSDPWTTQQLVEDRESELNDALNAALAVLSALAKENTALKAQYRAIFEESQTLKAELDAARPLLEAAMKAPTGNIEHAIQGRLTAHVRLLLRSVLAYRARKEAEGKERS